MTLCTCGEKVGQERHYDISDDCRTRRHDACERLGGSLLFSTGFHWWCACLCHPDPVLHDPPTNGEKRAFITLIEARRRAAAMDEMEAVLNPKDPLE